MNFEGIGNRENSLRLIMESVAEQLADEVQCEIVVLQHNTESFIFQPNLIPESSSSQRVGPSIDFVQEFIRNIIARLKYMYPGIDWEQGLTTDISPEGVATIRVHYDILNSSI